MLKLWSCFVLYLITVISSQHTLPESKCTLHDDNSVFQVQLTKTHVSQDCGGKSNPLVEEVKVTTERTAHLSNVFMELQSLVLRLMEANANLTRELHHVQDELRATKDVLALNNIAPSGCPSGYPIHNPDLSSCYVFINRALEWYDAQSFCSSTGGNLVAVESQEEMTFLFNYIKNNTDLQGNHFWTGGNDIAKENEWIWTGVNQPLNYTQWLEYPHPSLGPVQQPDNHRGDEHCLQLFYLHNYKWNDMYCGFKYFFICEYKLLPH